MRKHGGLELERVGQAVDGHPGAFRARVDLNVGSFVLVAGAFVAPRRGGDTDIGGAAYMAGVCGAKSTVCAEIVGNVLNGVSERFGGCVVDGDGPKG